MKPTMPAAAFAQSAGIQGTSGDAQALINKNTNDEGREPIHPKDETGKIEIKEGEKAYLFHVSPCSFKFKWEAHKRSCPDGVYRTTDPREIKDLDARVKARILTEVTGTKVHRNHLNASIKREIQED